MKLRVAFLLALSAAFGASMLVGLNALMPRLRSVPHAITRNIDLTVLPCGDSVDGTLSFPH